MAERLYAGALLVVQLGALWWFVRGKPRWRSLGRYWRWSLKDVVGFALPGLVGLVLLGRLEALTVVPGEFAAVRTLLPDYGPGVAGEMLGASLIGLAIGTALIVVVTRWRKLRKPFGVVGDVGALIPRGGGDLLPAAILSIVAGVTEELAFRLYLPLLLALVTGSGPVAFALATATFGAMHRYQGWAGVAGTTVVGGVLAVVYLSTGLLWLAMLLHALLDVNALVLRPWLTGLWRGR